MFSALLSDTTNNTNDGGWITWVILAVFIVIIVVFFVFSSRRNKKKQQEAQQLMDAVKPGNKVKTIGGVCGIVVEVDPEENTFVLETGSETSGKCYMKFDKQAIYQTTRLLKNPPKRKKRQKSPRRKSPSKRALPQKSRKKRLPNPQKKNLPKRAKKTSKNIIIKAPSA